jgi:hypothetical protein
MRQILNFGRSEVTLRLDDRHNLLVFPALQHSILFKFPLHYKLIPSRLTPGHWPIARVMWRCRSTPDLGDFHPGKT